MTKEGPSQLAKIQHQYKVYLPHILPWSFFGVILIKMIFVVYGGFFAKLNHQDALFSSAGFGTFILQCFPVMTLWNIIALVTKTTLHHEKPLSLISQFKQLILPILLGALVFSFLLYVGFLFVFVWVYALITLWLYPVELAHSQKGARQAFGHSYLMVSSRWWVMFRVLLMWVFAPILVYLFIRASLPLMIHNILDVIAYSLYLPWVTIASESIYHQCKLEMDKENE